MNYAAHYNRLIARARDRVLVGYRERHHVLPRCMGGGNEPSNLVELTAEEHYVAHQLLVKMYPGHHGLALSAVRMAQRASGNKAYGWLRRSLAASLRGKKRDPEIVKKIAIALRGRVISPEHRAKISAFHKGRPKSPEHLTKLRAHLVTLAKSPEIAAKRSKVATGNKYMLGKKRSPESIERTAAAHRGKVVSLETREKIAAWHLSKPLSLEHRAKISASLLGNTHNLGKTASPETRAKMSATRLGKKRGPHTPETRAKISLAKIGKVHHSLESRAKMSASRRGKPKSPEHRAKISAANYTRWERHRQTTSPG